MGVTIQWKADGTIDSYKTRFVRKGFTQTCSTNYQQTFVPLAKMTSICTFMSCVAIWIGYFNSKCQECILHDDLEQKVYVNVPQGFSSQSTVGKVCRLKKAIYGLRQSLRAWFDRFPRVIQTFGYKQSNVNHTMC